MFRWATITLCLCAYCLCLLGCGGGKDKEVNTTLPYSKEGPPPRGTAPGSGGGPKMPKS